MVHFEPETSGFFIPALYSRYIFPECYMNHLKSKDLRLSIDIFVPEQFGLSCSAI